MCVIKFSAEHIWLAAAKPARNSTGKIIDGLFTIDDVNGRESLFGNGEDLYKRLPEHRFMTNVIGPDCITRPDLCDNGFSVGFDLGGFHILFLIKSLVNLRYFSLICLTTC